MDHGAAVSRYVEAVDAAQQISKVLEHALWETKPRAAKRTGAFEVTGNVTFDGALTYYRVSEQRKLRGSIFGATYTFTSQKFDMATSTTDFANLLTEIRRALNHTFQSYVALMPAGTSAGLTTTTSTGTGGWYEATGTTAATAMGQYLFSPYRRPEDDNHNEIHVDTPGLVALMIATGKMKTPEQIAEEQAFESIRRSAQGQ